MRIRSILLAVQLTLVVVLIGVAVALHQNRLHAEEAEERHFRSYQLADQLRQSTDHLTRFARTYVTTGDPIYEQFFQRILGIHNGEAPRASGYGGIYRDIVAGGDAIDGPESAPELLRARMLDAGFTNDEFGKLSEAQNQLMHLSDLKKSP